MQIAAAHSWLHVDLGSPHRFLSWAPVKGGFARASQLALLYLQLDEIATVRDPARWLRNRMRRSGFAGAVGMMTSRMAHRYSPAGSSLCSCVATVGLSNALAAGDPAGAAASASRTINLFCRLSVPVHRSALVEAVALAAEARAAALFDSGVHSTVSGLPATGTGTDCIAVACPDLPPLERYCGKHTALGASIGQTVRQAVAHGIAEWRRDFPA